MVFSTRDVRSEIPGPGMTEQEPLNWWKALVESTHEALEKSGIEAEEICLSGGLTRSDLYLRILADVTGLTLHIPRETEASCFGAAILGAVAGGAYEDIHTASQSMVQYMSTISPDAENHRRYQFYLKKYEEAYVLMKDWMHEVSSYSLK